MPADIEIFRARLQAVDQDDVGAEVGQHHAGDRGRAKAGDFENAQARERAALV
ncbi:hypothetical protein D3C87_2194620 [compost metagenome]